MNNDQLISFIENTFSPLLDGNVGLDDDGNVSWSVDVSEIVDVEIDKLYVRLLMNEKMFEDYGYELILQDDNEFFGGTLIKK